MLEALSFPPLLSSSCIATLAGWGRKEVWQPAGIRVLVTTLRVFGRISSADWRGECKVHISLEVCVRFVDFAGRCP